MPDKWIEAHSRLVSALENAKAEGVDEDEARSALDDVYFEHVEDYKPGTPKRPKPLKEYKKGDPYP